MNTRSLLIVAIILLSFASHASKLVEVKVLDKEYIMVHFKDGEVFHRDDSKGKCAFMGHCHSADGSHAEYYGKGLDVQLACQAISWRLKSGADKDYKGKGLQPTAIHRKTKLNCVIGPLQ
jgi:endoglucanase